MHQKEHKYPVFHHMTPVILITDSLPPQDNDLLSPGIIINSTHCSGSGSGLSLEGSRHLSRSNIDIPGCSGPDDPKKQLPRKRSDSSTYELDTIKQHQAFLTRWTTVVLLFLTQFVYYSSERVCFIYQNYVHNGLSLQTVITCFHSKSSNGLYIYMFIKFYVLYFLILPWY